MINEVAKLLYNCTYLQPLPSLPMPPQLLPTLFSASISL